eukprot:scaffold890_cov269-Pinguiococcus_pyrenoidosus.AAC.8
MAYQLDSSTQSRSCRSPKLGSAPVPSRTSVLQVSSTPTSPSAAQTYGFSSSGTSSSPSRVRPAALTIDRG